MSIHLTVNKKTQITIDDWFRNFRQYQTDYAKLSDLAFQNRKEGNKVTDKSIIETKWNLYQTNELITNRLEEIIDARNLICDCKRNVENELQLLKYEKDLCVKDLQDLNKKFTLINECSTMRRERKTTDTCQDTVDLELNKEYQLLERGRKNLSEKCEEAWTQSMKLQTLINALDIDIEKKNEACQIENQTLNFAATSNIGHKPEMNRSINYVSYESWLENCKYLQSQAKEETEKSYKLRTEMCLPRENTYNEILAQYEATNFAFRKRIYETRYFLEELMWQKENLGKEKDYLLEEIYSFENKLKIENDALKLVESQNWNRIYRTNIELCQDKCTDNLDFQVMNLKQIRQKLNVQLHELRKTCNLLDEQLSLLEKEINGKNCAVTIDIRCLELRKLQFT